MRFAQVMVEAGIRTAFQAYIQSPAYINRERIEYSTWRQLHVFLDISDLKAKNQTESDSNIVRMPNLSLFVISSIGKPILSFLNHDMSCQRMKRLILLRINIYNYFILAEPKLALQYNKITTESSGKMLSLYSSDARTVL